MENDPTRLSRERINENYLRQMLRDNTNSCTRREPCANQKGNPLQSAPSCEMRGEANCLAGRSLAMVYSPIQAFRELYDVKIAICRGTIFKELDKPFLCHRG